MALLQTVRTSHGALMCSAWLAITLLSLASRAPAQTIVNGQMDGVADVTIFNAVVPPGWVSPLGTPNLFDETTTAGFTAWQASSDGGTFVHCAGSPLFDESFEQTVTGLIVGTDYTIFFEQTATDSIYTSDSFGYWEVTFGASTLDSTPTAVPTFGTSAPWEPQALTFTATSTSQLLQFKAKAFSSGLRADMGVDSGRIEEACTLVISGAEFVRLGTPPNPFALLPSGTGPPVIGAVWDPSIDHTSFVPTAVLDQYVLSFFAANAPFLPAGTILCAPPLYSQYRLPTDSLNLLIPDVCSLVDIRICVTAASYEASGAFFLTNALDITIGSI